MYQQLTRVFLPELDFCLAVDAEHKEDVIKSSTGWIAAIPMIC